MAESVWGIDTIDAQVPDVPRGAPVIWYYVTGSTQAPEIEWEPADAALFPHSQLYRIDQGFGNQLDSARAFDADEYDMEALAWSPERLAPVIRLRNQARWSTRVYASAEPWNLLLALAGREGIPMRSVFWREANWNYSEAEAAGLVGGQRYAIQWASPTSNPDTLIPGTTLTLRQANADLNRVRLASTGWQG